MSDPRAMTAPELQVAQWFNAAQPLSLSDLRGRVVLLHAFQMLCPGCVQMGTPQAKKIAEQFDASDLAVIGLHTVFEHHDVMTPRALEVFIHENRLKFPIGVDQPGAIDGLPQTMQAYSMRGTPTSVLIDRSGRIRMHQFGHVEDLVMGAALGSLLAEPYDA